MGKKFVNLITADFFWNISFRFFKTRYYGLATIFSIFLVADVVSF